MVTKALRVCTYSAVDLTHGTITVAFMKYVLSVSWICSSTSQGPWFANAGSIAQTCSAGLGPRSDLDQGRRRSLVNL